MASASTSSTVRERGLLEAARGGDEDAFRHLVEPRRGGAPRPLLSDARLAPRRRGRPPGRAAARLARAGAGSRTAARCGPGSTGSRPTPASTRSPGVPSACCRSTTARRPTRTTGPGEPLVESVWMEPYPDETLGLEDGYAAPEARYEQREARRARVHRGAAAPAGAPAGRAHPARGARLLRPGGRGDARDDRRLGQQRPSAGPQGRGRAASRAEPAGHPALPRRRRPPRGRRELHGCDAAGRRRGGGRDAGRGRSLVDAAAGELVRRSRSAHGVPEGRAAVGGVALAPRARSRKRAGGGRRLQLGRRGGELPSVRARRADPPGRSDQGGHRLHRSDHADSRQRDFARWPEQPVDPEMVRAVFERFGLPARLED